MIDREAVIGTLVELCEIRSPSFEEGPVRDYLRSAVETLGLKVSEDSRGNLYIRVDGNPDLEPIFLVAHMDTVPVPEGVPVRVVRAEGRIAGDGTTILGGDDKQGVAAALEMLRIAVEHPGSGRGLDVVFTVEEEMGSLGSRDIEPDRIRARQGYNLDGETAPAAAISRAPRKARYTATVTGRSSHAALDPDGGINAILVASQIIAALPLGAPDQYSTSNVGTIVGGRQTNVVPDQLRFTGEIRSFDAHAFERLREKTESTAQTIALAAGARVSFDWEETYDRYEVGPQEPCVRWFAEACRNTGLDPQFLSSRGGGDANQLNSKGLRCIVFGLGMHEIHSINEYVVEDEYLRAVDLLASIVFPDAVAISRR